VPLRPLDRPPVAYYPRFIMWGIAPKYSLAIVALLITAVVAALAWSLMSHLGFAVLMGCLGASLVGVWMLGLVRSAWQQASQLDGAGPRFAALPSSGLSSGLSSGSIRGTSLASRPAPRTTATPGPRRAARSRRRDEPPLLPENMTVSLSAERQAAGVDEVFTALDRQLVGLLPVKKKVEEIASLLLVDRVRQRFGLTAPRPNLHMCFTGEPGTGKTTMALQMGELLHRLGYLESGHVVHAMRDDLVGQFIGHTAPKTKRVLEQAMGGVLFIDEAYYLYRAADSKDYGQECIDILLQVMENSRDKLVVILAGYKDRMEEFFECNPGMSSRVAHHLDFAPYRIDELLAIGHAMLGEASYYLSDSAETAFRDYLTLQMDQPRFANARSVRNELEQARLRHAHRLAADPDRSWTKDDLMRIEPLDVFPNPAFAAPARTEAARPGHEP
jgi:probable Rubsico expression protein CbbX